MSGLVTVAVAGDAVEAGEIRSVLQRAGIEAELEGAETEVAGEPHDGPCRVLVADNQVEMAREALADADEDDEEL